MSNTTISPAVGAVRLMTNSAPMIASAALALAGVVPKFGWLITIPIGGAGVVPTVALIGGSPILQELEPTTTGPVTLTGYAPSLNLLAAAVTPAVGVMSLAGAAPALGTGLNEPIEGMIGMTGFPPIIGAPNVSQSIPSGVLTFTGNPSGLTGQSSPITVAIGFSGALAQLNFSLVLSPAQTAVLGLSGNGPALGLVIAPLPGLLRMTTLKAAIQPSAGGLIWGGSVPAIGGAVACAPTTAGLVLSGGPVEEGLTVPAAPTANLVLSGYYPSLTLNSLALPPGATLTLGGNAPGGIQAGVLVPGSGTLLLGAVSPPGIAFLGFNLFIPSGAVLGTGRVAGQSESSLLAPAAAGLGLSGVAGALIPGVSRAPAPAILSLQGSPPGIAVTPAGTSLFLAGGAPLLGLGLGLPGAVLALASTPPTVNGRLQLVIPGGSVSLAGAQSRSAINALVPGSALSLSGLQGSIGMGLAPGTMALGLLGSSLILNQSGLPHPVSGSLSLMGAQPLVGIGARVPAGSVGLAGALPVVDSLITLTPISGAAILVGTNSAVDNTGVIVPLSAGLALGSDSAQVIRSGFVASDTAALSCSGAPPGLVLTLVGLVEPASATMSLGGQPAVTPYYDADPYYRVALAAGLFILQLPPGKEG